MPLGNEYGACALNPVGSYLGGVQLKLTREDIMVFDNTGKEIGTWPYNCIRQFREEKDVFAFTSGRRGPYGVNEYLFQMSPRSLPKLKQTISDYTGAKFQSFDETPVSSDETPPYLHGNHSPEAPRTARHTSSGRYERNAPLPKPRSHSASRQKLDTIKPLPLSSMLADRSLGFKPRSGSVQVEGSAKTLQTMFSQSRQHSVPAVMATAQRGGHFQDELKNVLSRSTIKAGDQGVINEGGAPLPFDYVNGERVREINTVQNGPGTTAPRSRSKSGSPVESPPRSSPPRPVRPAPPLPNRAGKPVTLQRRFIPVLDNERDVSTVDTPDRMRRARSVGYIDDLDIPVSEDAIGEVLLDQNVVFGSTKDKHLFGSRVSPRSTPSPTPSSPSDEYVKMEGAFDAANLRPVPAPRRRSHSLHRQGYENAEIVDLHKNGLLRMQRLQGEVPAGLRRQLSADRGTRQHHVVASVTHRMGSSSGSVSSDMDEYEPMSSLRREDDDYIVMKSATKSRPIEYEDMQPYPVGRERIEQYTVVTSPAQRSMRRSSSVDNLILEGLYAAPRSCVAAVDCQAPPLPPPPKFSAPRTRTGYDHLETPGLKVAPNHVTPQKKSALLRPDFMVKIEGQPVTAC